MAVFHYSWVDFLFTCLGLVFLLADIGLDVAAAVSLYQERALVSLGFLLLFLLGSSLLVQAFSWLWYSYDSFKRDTRVESCLSLAQLRLLHLLQLGIYFRYVVRSGAASGSFHLFTLVKKHFLFQETCRDLNALTGMCGHMTNIHHLSVI